MELRGLAGDAGSVEDSARSALIAINKDINEGKNLSIITAAGLVCTKAVLFSEKLDGGVDDISKDTIGKIIQTTKNVADSRRNMTVEGGMAAPQGAEPAVLLTDTANTRLKAKACGVPAISITTLMMYIRQLRPNGSREDEA